MKKAVKCEGRVSIEYIKSCEEYTGSRLPEEPCANLSDLCNYKDGLYYFNSKWYDNIDADGITYKNGKKLEQQVFMLHHQKIWIF